MTSGDNACKMQALWRCFEDEVMILTEGSLVGRDGGKGVLRFCVLLCACVGAAPLPSSFSCPKSPQATSHGFSPAHV